MNRFRRFCRFNTARISRALAKVFRSLALICWWSLLGDLSSIVEAADPPGITVLRSGGGMPLVTSVQELQIPAGTPPLELFFEFGFSTDETSLPGEFLDSFSVTVQDAAMLNTLLLLTADAGGVLWAPPTPGGVLLAPDSIVRSTVAFPDLQPMLGGQVAFAVRAPLPAGFSGSVNVYFDLFDNLNSSSSLGWHSAVVIPEPRLVWPLVIAVLLAWTSRRKRY